MNVEITARHAPVSKSIKEHVEQKLQHALKQVDTVTSVHVVLDAEKARQMAEFIVRGKNLAVTVHAESDDMRRSIDRCAEKLRHQLEHLLGRRHTRRRRADPLSRIEAELAARAAIAPEPEPEPEPKVARPRVVRVRARRVKVMSLDVARGALDAGRSEALIFRDEDSDRVHVLFRRADGDYGLVDAGAP